MLTETREKLAQAEDRLRALRDEKRRGADVKRAAVAAAEANDDDASYSAAEAAAEALRSVEAKIEQTQEEQVGLLRRLGDQEAGFAGFSSPGINGWHEAARTLSLSDGALRADVSAQSLLQPGLAPLMPRVPSQAAGPAVEAGNRWTFPMLPSAPFPGAGDLVATDFVVSLSVAEVTGLTGVEIPPATATPKAELPFDVALATPTAQTFAIVAENVPVKLFSTRDALQAFLGREMSRHLNAAYDRHVIDAIESAAPPTGSTGAGLVSRIRNAIASMRDLGGEPRVVSLTPADAATLDLEEDGAGNLIFAVKASAGGEAPGGDGVWRLAVRESPAVSAPLLLDPATVGVSYLANGSVLVDPYGANLKTNQVSVRVEIEARWHTRNIIQGAFAIA